MTQRNSVGKKTLPTVMILATGGTIAGRPVKPGSLLDYEAGVEGVETLIASIPGLSDIAHICWKQVAAIGSEDMTGGVWLDLAAEVNEALLSPEIGGVVVLHGTDTMEETAVFLDLTCPVGKPVVMTGAMRPAGAVSEDGPLNILNAVRIACCSYSVGRGVLVAMNDTIHRARDVVKSDTVAVQTFQSPRGVEGRVVDGAVRFFRDAGVRTLPVFSLHDVHNADELPRVEIIYGHAGQERTLVDAALAAGAWGVVHAGVGMGLVHVAAVGALAEAVAGGVPVVCATRVFSGPVPYTEKMRRHNFISAGWLNPQKARVVLLVALTRSNDIAEIRHWFDEYQ